MRSLLPIIIIISILATSVIIPADAYARYEIRQEETFGDPGDDPHLATNPLYNIENSEDQATSYENAEKCKKVSIFSMYLKIVFNQLSGLVF